MAKSKNNNSPLTLESLSAQVEGVLTTIAKLPDTKKVAAKKAAMDDQIKEIKEQLVDPSTLASVESVNALELKLEAIAIGVEAVLAENAELKADVERLSTVKPSINVQAAEAKKPVEIPQETFTVDEQKYRFKLARFTIAGLGTVDAKDALLDKKLCAKIVTDFPSIVEAV